MIDTHFESLSDISDWQRKSAIAANQNNYKDEKDLQFLLRCLPDAFNGATCPEVEDRFLNILGYVNGTFDQSVLSEAVISENQISIVGKEGSEGYELGAEYDSFVQSSKDGTEKQLAVPLLEFMDNQKVFEVDKTSLESQTILVKNPYNRISGETFPMVKNESGSWGSPLVIGTQNGFLLREGKLVAVDGMKNKQTGMYEWKIKRPVFDTGKYEKLEPFKKALEAHDLRLLVNA